MLNSLAADPGENKSTAALIRDGAFVTRHVVLTTNARA
jgi:hypothetical protein